MPTESDTIHVIH